MDTMKSRACVLTAAKKRITQAHSEKHLTMIGKKILCQAVTKKTKSISDLNSARTAVHEWMVNRMTERDVVSAFCSRVRDMRSNFKEMYYVLDQCKFTPETVYSVCNLAKTLCDIIWATMDDVATLEEKEAVNHPSHYNFGQYEVLSIIQAYDLSFCTGNALKYLARAGKKGDEVEDLKKAHFYLNQAVMTEGFRVPHPNPNRPSIEEIKKDWALDGSKWDACELILKHNDPSIAPLNPFETPPISDWVEAMACVHRAIRQLTDE